MPKDADDSLPSLLPADGQVQRVTRQRGAQLETDVAASWRFLGDKMGVWTSYQYSQKAKDKFSGPGNLYYDGLAKNTDWQLHAGEVGIDYSTIPLFRRGKFALPLEVSLLYNKALKGRNTPDVSYARMDFMLYF